jgi:hypothetical protein
MSVDTAELPVPAVASKSLARALRAKRAAHNTYFE